LRLVIVGDGLLGRTLYAASDDSDVVVMLGHADIDVTSSESIMRAFAQHEPDVVINTAARHRLGECEDNPALAYDVNARGAERVAELARTIYVSSDYVFNDGGPHTECLPGQQPRSIYGRSKLGGEIGTLEQGGIVVRVAGLYGHFPSHKGPSFPEMIVGSHDPIKLPTDQIFSPTYAPDAAERILAIANDPKADGIYHATNRGFTSWAGFAEHILGLTRHDRHVLPYAAHDPLRPKNSALVSKRLPALPFWADALGRWALREEHVPFVSPLRDK
jgi:dTDP-4-dehydrorhamnose reductase